MGSEGSIDDLQVRVSDHPATDAATWLAQRLAEAVSARGVASLAVSGGSTAPPLFEALSTHDLAWDSIEIWQVDERVVPDGHPDRNAEQLTALPARAHLMPVTDPDLEAAAAQYAATLPPTFDVVHLGLGDDGHTASWPPGLDAVASSRRPVEVVPEFNGHRRMTLTAGVVNGAHRRLMLTHGAAKGPMMVRWLSADHTIPVWHLRRAGTVAFVDPSASPWNAANA